MNHPRALSATLLLPLLLLAGTVCPAAAADPIEDELARYAEAAAKLQQSYDDSLDKERARALATLLAQAKREPSVNAGAVWKLVLALDPANDEARRWLTANGQLDEALADIAAQKGPLLGDGRTTAGLAASKPSEPRIDMSGARLIKVPASRGGGVGLGTLRAGTIIIVQYVSGKWSSNRRLRTAVLESPDDDKTGADNQAVIVDTQNDPPIALATVPAGSADNPYVLTLTKDATSVTLRISRTTGGMMSYEGEAQYRVKIIPPAGNR